MALRTVVRAARTRTASLDARIMGSVLVGMGTLHFVVPRPFDRIVPPEIPGDPRTMTYVSGAAELGIGAGLLYPPTRRPAAAAAAALFVAVFPANVHSVRLQWRKPVPRYLAIARLPLQAPMIAAALRIRRLSR